jgi:hypothetical protein
MIIETPDKFRIKMPFNYPPINETTFEEYFYKKILENKDITDRVYLPIFWANVYVSRNYHQSDISDIQLFLDKLDRKIKYYTIVQYDDNIVNDLKDLDILIFAMNGHGEYKDKCYPIPLNCLPPSNIEIKEKDIFASFIGTIKNPDDSPRHPIRYDMIDAISDKKEYLIIETRGFKPELYNEFIDIMSRTVFSLSPRGYGLSSFRICEALQFESIPVFIYDIPFIPFYTEYNFEDIGVLIDPSNIKDIDSILKSISKNRIKEMIENGREIYNKFYDYHGCYDSIIRILKR